MNELKLGSSEIQGYSLNRVRSKFSSPLKITFHRLYRRHKKDSVLGIYLTLKKKLLCFWFPFFFLIVSPIKQFLFHPP